MICDRLIVDSLQTNSSAIKDAIPLDKLYDSFDSTKYKVFVDTAKKTLQVKTLSLPRYGS